MADDRARLFCRGCRLQTTAAYHVDGERGLCELASCAGMIAKIDAAYNAIRDAAQYNHDGPADLVRESLERALAWVEDALVQWPSDG